MHKIILEAGVRALLELSEDEDVHRDQILQIVERTIVYKDHLDIVLRPKDSGLNTAPIQFHTDEIIRKDDETMVRVHGRVSRRGGEKVIVGPDGKAVISSTTPDPLLVRNIVQAFEWREGLESGKYQSIQAVAEATECMEGYVRKLLPLAYLAPDIVEAILDGRQPAKLELQHLTGRKLSLDWADQRKRLGFVA